RGRLCLGALLRDSDPHLHARGPAPRVGQGLAGPRRGDERADRRAAHALLPVPAGRPVGALAGPPGPRRPVDPALLAAPLPVADRRRDRSLGGDAGVLAVGPARAAAAAADRPLADVLLQPARARHAVWRSQDLHALAARRLPTALLHVQAARADPDPGGRGARRVRGPDDPAAQAQ